jgi:hypothetical protein
LGAVITPIYKCNSLFDVPYKETTLFDVPTKHLTYHFTLVLGETCWFTLLKTGK